MDLQIAPIFYPTTAILIDDNKTFLKALTLRLDGNTVYHTFSDPKEALEYCKHNAKKTSLYFNDLLKNIETVESTGVDEQNITLYTKGIQDILLKPDRFSTISTIVIDFSMPTLTGEEFIDRLKESIGHTAIKIIMVTGEAGHGLAVGLFNDKKIDKFFLKSESELERKINHSIIEMQNMYFSDTCTKIFGAFIEKMAPALVEPEFESLFSTIVKDLNIVEYYLCDNTGSFILVDQNGKINFLAIRTKEDLEMYADVARDQRVAQELIDRIKTGHLIPFFGTFKDFISARKEDWVTNVYPGKKANGKESYYYSIISGEKIKSFAYTKEISSFDDYLDKN